MQISRKTEYAIHTLMILAYNFEQEMSVDELASMQAISKTYLAKVMQRMAGAGIVQSSKGFQGGYSLVVPPQEISLAWVVGLFEDVAIFYQCLHDDRSCPLKGNCTIHRAFERVYLGMITELEKVKLADLLTSFSK